MRRGGFWKRRSALCWESGGSQGALTKDPFRSLLASFAFRHSSFPAFGNFGLLASCCHSPLVETGSSLLSAQAAVTSSRLLTTWIVQSILILLHCVGQGSGAEEV